MVVLAAPPLQLRVSPTYAAHVPDRDGKTHNAYRVLRAPLDLPAQRVPGLDELVAQARRDGRFVVMPEETDSGELVDTS